MRGFLWRIAIVVTVSLTSDLLPQVLAKEIVVVGRNQVTLQQFERWVFQHFRSMSNARESLLAELTLKVDELDRICNLDDSQRRKLSLAGRGDMKRFFDTYERVKTKFQRTTPKDRRIDTVFQEIAPLQTAIQAGLFDGDSFIHRSLKNVLTDAQRTKYLQVQQERQRIRHQAAVELTVHTLDEAIPLLASQRDSLIDMLLALTRPARRSGQHDYYTIMYQIARMPPDQFRTILDETQWKILAKQIDNAKAMKPWLEQRGGLPIEEDNHDWL
jgi:hypothetical protein